MAAPSHLLQSLFRPTPPLSSSSATFLRSPVSIIRLNAPLHSTTSTFCSVCSQHKLRYANPPTRISFHNPRFKSLHTPASTPHAIAATLSEQNLQFSEPEESGIEEDNNSEDVIEDEELEETEQPENKIEAKEVVSLPERSVPNLTVKEKKDLASYAHSLGDKLKSQQVGKSGVTENVVMALGETLERNELLKLKIHKSCPGEMEDVVNLLERTTGSVAVSQIGRTVIFYRPSMKKMKVEEKMRQTRRVFVQQKARASRPAFTVK